MYVIKKLRLNSKVQQCALPTKRELFNIKKLPSVKYSEDANFDDPIEYRTLSKNEMFEAGERAMKQDYGEHVKQQVASMIQAADETSKKEE